MAFQNTEFAKIDLNREVPFFTFPVLEKLPYLRHGFSTKLGGISSGMFTSMNLGSETSPYQDDSSNIEENYRRIASSIGFPVESVVVSMQVHKTDIRLVDEHDCGKGLFRTRDYDEIDGLITNRPGVTLVTKYADCVPLYFVDPVKRAIGLSHSGWRGTVKKIGKITVEKMQKCFGSDPGDIIAVIGPSICHACYEISEEVAQEFRTAFPKDYHKILTGNNNGNYQCDLWTANQTVLIEAGLLAGHINTSRVCTSCHSDLLFSHRRTQGKRGSLAAFLELTD